jgi:alkanesulfonate monooxygenase SsuD/methylene tetrahydromethanopterin reductase-like flavin-dependent oxidoreductase (luciferase family)
MRTRGKRADEMIEILRLICGGGGPRFVEYHGKHYDFDRLIMASVPKKLIPNYVGGSSKPAILRAARYGDGWIGIVHGRDEIAGIVAELATLRREYGREKEPRHHAAQPHAATADDVRRLEDLGVTDLQIAPWNLPGIHAQLGVSAMGMQPPLAITAIARALCGRRHRHSERIEAEHESRHHGETGFPDRRRVGLPAGPDLVARPDPK